MANLTITLDEAYALRAHAKRRNCVRITLAAAAIIDVLSGEEGFDPTKCESDLFGAIEDRRDAPEWYAAMRECHAASAHLAALSPERRAELNAEWN